VTIIEQQIALAAAQRGERWLVGWAGDCIEYKGEHFYTFPRRERLAAATVDDLTPLKITFIRMARLIDLALTFDPEPLRALPHEAAYRALVALKGVGHWTAAWTLMRGANQPVYVGSADVALRAAVNHYWHGAKGRADTAATDALFARFGAFGGLAAFTTLMRWALDRYPRDG
jgi:DNA-3-methyladenine glycosylase II